MSEQQLRDTRKHAQMQQLQDLWLKPTFRQVHFTWLRGLGSYSTCFLCCSLILFIQKWPQFYQQEATKLRRQIRDVQNMNRSPINFSSSSYTLCLYLYLYTNDVCCRHILGEALSSLTFKELKNLEGRLEKGICRIRSKKVFFFFCVCVSCFILFLPS